MKKIELMTTEDVLRALKRMAHQIAERNSGASNVVVLGIVKGGVPIAAQIATYLSAIENTNVPCGTLDIWPYRDDLDKTKTAERDLTEDSLETNIPCDIEGKDVVLVDDVLFTGRTARAAFDALSDYGRAGTIQLAVLVDRGHRELPIRADYVGKNVPTSKSETISVEFNETGMGISVSLC